MQNLESTIIDRFQKQKLTTKTKNPIKTQFSKQKTLKTTQLTNKIDVFSLQKRLKMVITAKIYNLLQFNVINHGKKTTTRRCSSTYQNS